MSYLKKKSILNFTSLKLAFHVFAIYFFSEYSIKLKFGQNEALQGGNKSDRHFFEILIFFKMAAIFMPKYVKTAVGKLKVRKGKS